MKASPGHEDIAIHPPAFSGVSSCSRNGGDDVAKLTLEIIWDLCYLHDHSTIKVLPQLPACLEAVEKYHMTALYPYLARDLTGLLAEDGISRLRI